MNGLPESPPEDPLREAAAWLDDATEAAVQRHANAMTLATVSADGKPSARVVLLKYLSSTDGFATFYTHYESRKAIEIAATGYAAAVLHWDKLGRQIRFEGPIVRAPEADSDEYFATRPLGSQINAWVSAQSRPLDSIESLVTSAREKMSEFGVDADESGGAAVARPAFWGGYRLWLDALEFWQEGADRFHERVRYERELTPRDAHGFDAGPWNWRRLQP